MLIKKLLLISRTLPHLKAGQLISRLTLPLRRISIRIKAPPIGLTFRTITITAPITSPQTWTGTGFIFLNHEIAEYPPAWNAPTAAKLWLYNLHYFDYLQQAEIETEEGVQLIRQWIADNPPFTGNGWEPYTLSLRIVNWLKFLERHPITPQAKTEILSSLYHQVAYLRRQIEYHLLANHLLKNAVALLFAGACIDAGRVSKEWFDQGLQILKTELSEQILQDGGHFERSPMYHAIALEDMLDCLNLLANLTNTHNIAEIFVAELQGIASTMLTFLIDVVHANGTYPRFNDSAEGVASSLDELIEYARRLGIQVKVTKPTSDIISKPNFGLHILAKGPWRCLIDHGPIGPDYQPGHAHCDTLSFELTLAGKLLCVNSGTYEYAGQLRNAYRSTAAHNTLQIDGQEQHEIWSTFRVARRGYPKNLQIKRDGNKALVFYGEHTGYQRLSGKPIHGRSIQITPKSVLINDRVLSQCRHYLVSRIHLHPDVQINFTDLKLLRGDLLGQPFVIEVKSGKMEVKDYQFSYEFGLQEPAKVVTISIDQDVEQEISYRIGIE